jgi:hypothetical protein
MSCQSTSQPVSGESVLAHPGPTAFSWWIDAHFTQAVVMQLTQFSPAQASYRLQKQEPIHDSVKSRIGMNCGEAEQTSPF